MRLCQDVKPRAEAGGCWSPRLGAHAQHPTRGWGAPSNAALQVWVLCSAPKCSAHLALPFRAVIFLAVRGENVVQSSLALQRDSCERRDMFIFPAPTSTSNAFSFSVLQKGIFPPPSLICQRRLPANSPGSSSAPGLASPGPQDAPDIPFSTGRAGQGLMFLLPRTSSKKKKNPRNWMFCVTQISVFHFGFQCCQVAWEKKINNEKKDIKGLIFSNPTPATRERVSSFEMFACLLQQKQSGNCSQHCKIFRLTQIPAFLQLEEPLSPLPGLGLLGQPQTRARAGAQRVVPLRSSVGWSRFIFFFPL